MHRSGSRRLPWLLLLLASGPAAQAASIAGPVALDDKAHYPEGPLWWRGQLYYVEYTANDIKRWDGHAGRAFWQQDKCGASGLIAFGQDHLLVACYDANMLIELDAAGRTVRTIDADVNGKPFTGPNDFAADGHGGVWFSASGVYDVKAPITGAVLHLPPGQSRPRVVADTIHYSNGLTLSHDGRQLLVAEMLAARILAFPVQADGTLGPRTVWARLQDLAPPTAHEDAYNGPDGLKAGNDGNYYIAQNGSGRVLVVNEARKLVRSLQVPTPFVTNIAFGAQGASEVFITGAFDQWKPPFAGVVYRWTR